jgi:hypothetical protein
MQVSKLTCVHGKLYYSKVECCNAYLNANIETWATYDHAA